MRKRYLVPLLVLATLLPLLAVAQIANVSSQFVNGDLYFYDKSQNEIFHLDAQNRKLVIPSGSSITVGGAALSAGGTVGAAAGTGVVATESAGGAIHSTVLTLTNLSVTMTDATTNGSEGTQKIYDFPEGAIQILGASYNLTTARVGTALAANAAVVCSLGSVAAAADDTLTSTEADMIASTTGTLSSGAGSCKKHGSINTTAFDGHTTPLDGILNFAVPDAGSTGNDALTVNGTITIVWANLGDY